MPRVAKPYDPVRIALLKTRIGDPEYVDSAIDRLAGRITDRLLGLDEITVYADRSLYRQGNYRRASSSKNENAERRNEDE